MRKSGRVRLHKARENANGTFSIGKTWNMDELSAVQSFNGSNPNNAQEERFKQWAGGVGFIVVLGKPYYWQANTQKEKQFFIASLVKIYTKYTGGKFPELIGFDPRERDLLLGASGPPRPQGPNVPPSLQAPAPPTDRPLRGPPSRDQLGPPRSRDGPPRPQGQFQYNAPPSLTPQNSRPPTRSQRDESPNSSIDSTGVPPPQPLSSLRRLANNNQSQDSFGRSDDATSLPPRSRGGVNGTPNAPGRFPDRSTTPTSQRATTPETGLAPKDSYNEVPPLPAPLSIPPERRRPPIPIGGDPRQRGLGYNDPMVPAPLASPGMRRDDVRLPQKNNERTQQKNSEQLRENKIVDGNGDVAITPRTGASASQPLEQPTVSVPEKTPTADSIPSTSTVPVLPEEVPVQQSASPLPASADVKPATPVEPLAEPAEETRPGLGPMIKKKSKADIANTFLKAAKTANAFKPRPGGAAERLRANQNQNKTAEGPDGITGVVPAPSLTRAQSEKSVTTEHTITSDNNAQDKANSGIPEVKITIPQSRPTSVEAPPKAQQVSIITEKQQEEEKEKPKPREVRRPKPAAELMQKELAFLGIEPSVLQGKGEDIVSFWDEFGYAGDGVRTTNIEQMKEEIERELNKAQTGGWLARFDEEDGRIEGIKKGIDQCITECDELDNLFTLYLVELDVSLYPLPILPRLSLMILDLN